MMAAQVRQFGDGGISRPVYSRRPRNSEAHPVLFWFLAFVDAFVFFGAVYYAILPLSHDDVISFHAQAVAVATAGAAAVGGAVLVWRMRKHDELQWVETEYEAVEPAPVSEPDLFVQDDRRELGIRTVRGNCVIVQPRPGAFAGWLRDVVNPDNKVTFSQNEAKRREWEDWMYVNLVAQLKGVGWIHAERRLNGAPDLDVQFRDEMQEWLKTPLL